MSAIIVDDPHPSTPAKPPKYAETIHRLYRKGATVHLSRVIEKLAPTDIAQVINSSLDPKEAMDLFELINCPMNASRAIKDVNEEFQNYIFSHVTDEAAVGILERLTAESRMRVIHNLSSRVGGRLMESLQQTSQIEAGNLSRYQSNSAGSLMTSRFFSLPDTTLAGAAVQIVRELSAQAPLFYAYTVNAENHLTGVCSLRQLLLSPADRPIAEIVDHDVMSVHVSTPVKEVARKVTRARLLAIPVVNDQGVMCGIITVNDLIHDIRAADTQSMLRMADVYAKLDVMSQTFVHIAKSRIPWLIAPFMGGLAAAWILSHYEHTLATVIQLSFFMPMIFGMAGNVSNQATTVAIRGLATGKIKVNNYLKLLFKETSVGVLVGGFYGVCLSTYAMVVFKSTTLAFVVGISILSNILYAGIIAASLPILLQKMGHDPAVGGGPYVLTTVDVLGVINYLLIATFTYGL
ncbi:Magnesium transporter MgtE [Candidatus Magnetaquicoccaceae bacterium FCR-1]|uniref:Magnesium transporter MgtE n=1 Tax=Candidatus Magnetaquiglobus chichijimensis TaxID=3141448 RepID=A0ABQ0CCT0_9PROT